MMGIVMIGFIEDKMESDRPNYSWKIISGDMNEDLIGSEEHCCNGSLYDIWDM